MLGHVCELHKGYLNVDSPHYGGQETRSAEGNSVLRSRLVGRFSIASCRTLKQCRPVVQSPRKGRFGPSRWRGREGETPTGAGQENPDSENRNKIAEVKRERLDDPY